MELKFGKSLKLGDEGEDVELLHFYLRKLGFYDRGLSSKFSHSTAVAVEEWQKSKNLAVTGEIGEEDIKVINAELAPPPAAVVAAPAAPAALPANTNRRTTSADTDTDRNSGSKMSPFRIGVLVILGTFLLLFLAFLVGQGLTGDKDKESGKAVISATSEPTPTPAAAEATPGPTEEPKATDAPAQNVPVVVDNSGTDAADKAKIKELEDRLKKIEADKAKKPPASTPAPTAAPKPTATPAPAVIKVPAVITGGSAVLGRTSAVINGKVNPNNAETSYWVEYGESTAGLQSTSMKKVTGGTSKEVSFEITGLSAGTEYKYRLVADNSKGTTHGEFKSFVTTAASSTPSPTSTPEPSTGYTTDDINISVTLSNGLLKISASPVTGKSFPDGTKYSVYLNNVFYSSQGWVDWNNAGNSIKVDYPGGTVQAKIAVQLPNGNVIYSRVCQYPQ